MNVCNHSLNICSDRLYICNEDLNICNHSFNGRASCKLKAIAEIALNKHHKQTLKTALAPV
ncbi:hypothetical protein PI95_033845 [Hassallia byssoidea VB512170]|uniref:Uncharacterized protein n=1 Tax=Hassallia byssoidea VB512170 TaxID=1304833 RepID=A0A846HPI0_9CYAN|nr:hypothetical protein [Hassalia byssoidea]NEU77331.1 hypothetical protein [Hassalia byssoidea VB512170]